MQLLNCLLAACIVVGALGASLPVRNRRQVKDWNDPTHPFPDSDWSNWTPCTTACDGGKQGRHNCSTDFEMPDLGSSSASPSSQACRITVADCNLFSCVDPVDWQEWSDCDVPCGGGLRERRNGPNCEPTICPPGSVAKQEIACHNYDCATPDGCGIADLVFVLDSSGSLSERNWYETKQFVIDVIKALDVSSDETRVSVISYSTGVSLEFDLDAHFDKATLESVIWDMPYMAGTTNTADGIRLMRDVYNRKRRADVKSIAVVVTDGKSNILPETTALQAELAQQERIDIFAVGVGAGVNEDELNSIASLPSDYYVHMVDDYDALSTITQTIIDETCESAARLECTAWTDFTQCSVSCGGGGLQERTRTCRLVDMNGVEIDSTDFREERECGTEDCPTTTTTTTTTTPAPTTTTTTQAPTTTTPAGPPDCTMCVYGASSVYFPDPEDCSMYYQCSRWVLGHDKYSYARYHLPCGPGTYWNQEMWACAMEPSEECKIVTATEPTEAPTTSTTTESTCLFAEIPGQPQKFLWIAVNIEMSCPDGTVFSQRACMCILADEVCSDEDGLLLHFPFDEHLNDVTCNKAHADKYGDVELSDSAAVGKSAYFNGQSLLVVNYMTNIFNQVPMEQFSIALWFKTDGAQQGIGGLVNNGHCYTSPSFDVHASSGSISTGSLDTDVAAMLEMSDFNVPSDDWVHVAMVYNGQQLIFYVNAVQQTPSENLTGFIENRKCPMAIGRQGMDETKGFFRGYMDDLRVYTKALTSDDVQNLYDLRL